MDTTAAIKAIREDLGRAKSYLRRDRFIQSIECAVRALQARAGLRLLGKDRYEIEFMFVEYCDEFSKHVKVLKMLEKMKIRRRPFVAYESGKEHYVAGRLDIVRTRMEDLEREFEERREEETRKRRLELLREGQKLLNRGETPRGKAMLRRAVDAFGDQPGLMTDVGRRMLAANLHPEAIGVLEEAVARFPDDHEAYTHLVAAYRAEGEYEKAEDTYLAALKRFGNHPVTCLNLSRLYLEQRKRDKAFEYAKMAYEADPTLVDAKEIMDDCC